MKKNESISEISSLNEKREIDLMKASIFEIKLDLINKNEAWKKIAKLSNAEEIRSNHNEVKKKYKTLLEFMKCS
jgi:hypothetical protein|tara:strand:+ start:5750 stop:5971 length:222 start_codon:yes stop_codon:yes gene_type:complete